MKTFKFLFLALLPFIALGQSTTATINKVPKSQFYKVLVANEIRSVSKSDFGDLRIFDAKKNEIPFVIATENSDDFQHLFQNFKIIKTTTVAKKITTISVANPLTTINEITLQIANSSLTKTFSLSGSNDQNQWFGLLNKASLSDLTSSETTSIYKTVSFPLTSYKFIKIEFDDTKTLPIEVLQIGQFKTTSQTESLEEIKPEKSFTTELKDQKKTVIKVTFKFPQELNKVAFAISNPLLYNRFARIYTYENQTIKRKKVQVKTEIAAFTLVSNSKNEFNLNPQKSAVFYIEIENKNNQLLSIDAVQFYQKPVYLIANLKANENYLVTTENPNLEMPDYDLVYFQKDIKNSTAIAKMTNINHKKRQSSATNTTSIWQKPWFMWLCIAIIGIAILFFSNSLLKDLKKNL